MTIPTGTARLAALQIGSRTTTAEALAALMARRDELKAANPDLLVLPEALLGGYPKGADFGVRLGYRTPAGRDAFRRYWEQAIEIDGQEVAALGELAADLGCTMVVGAIVRAGATLHCSALHFTPDGRLAGHRSKLMPTAAERLIWGQGGPDDVRVFDSPIGRIAPVICWENFMPLFRAALYGQGVTIWAAPTVDDRPQWEVAMRHIAHEGRCFLVSACQWLGPTQTVLGEPITLIDRAADVPIIGGGSIIVSPMGEVLAGPLRGGEGLLVAEVDLADIVRARFDFDAAGHYARPDIFRLDVTRPSR
ncbi:carbon-nitrogen hydrolase family protein [Sandarakinorhabdus limnophila]|uniref:carbon-nitrogen hydrolase family protein n=2 Tax=Sandarakinorhabdus limnophila TaxID=210512 RepID=UPI0026ECBD2D|nr:carbon-nitrogen hydrolase family protein [Sandarakinorhabdus limnophila]